MWLSIPSKMPTQTKSSSQLTPILLELEEFFVYFFGLSSKRTCENFGDQCWNPRLRTSMEIRKVMVMFGRFGRFPIPHPRRSMVCPRQARSHRASLHIRPNFFPRWPHFPAICIVANPPTCRLSPPFLAMSPACSINLFIAYYVDRALANTQSLIAH